MGRCGSWVGRHGQVWVVGGSSWAGVGLGMKDTGVLILVSVWGWRREGGQGGQGREGRGDVGAKDRLKDEARKVGRAANWVEYGKKVNGAGRG
ncbi:hypothetical protein E2C01_040848 [Portunus trituberculatus]|uniref:Uncharacterized protein n=1 Tax=Portunus trituberculatus TaxID=210409 RepID=A0A5B7FPV7_PORTR|nr:hypothetical protein [Portunus trituberculatus]